MGLVSAKDRDEGQVEGMASETCPTEALVALAQLVVTGAGHSRLTHEAARATARALGADRCEVLHLEPEGYYMSCIATNDEDAACGESGLVPYGVSSVAGYALLCGAPVVSEDVREERRFEPAGTPRWEGSVSAVAAPVPCRGGAFGALVAYAARAGAFGPRHALSISRTASLLGGALERLEEHEELRRRAEGAEYHGGLPERAHERSSERAKLGLTDRQLEVLALLADGCSAKQIASDLALSIHTVHFHQRNLYRALGVGSSIGALKRAAELGLLGPPGTGPSTV
ncbi:GAF domain-containing protein [Rubrobacter marinus]|uniref:GAF domain-containing protein n=1 Tax=Rubrobacter marinus TaxID=2653852 RepID=A0A6G8PVS4_9ACTN|nr:LuxR C-terminal-related transcriptional regulator [Rubrobacter marinus]QIN78309.1 GAF domain-containing protein [Rubrobacter marinus]